MPEVASSSEFLIRVEPVIAYRGTVPAWAEDYSPTNPFFTFWFLERGRVRLDWSGGSCTVPAGRCVLIPPGLSRRQRFTARARLTSLSFRAVWEGGRPLLQLPGPLVPPERPGARLGAAARRAVARGRLVPWGGSSVPHAASRLALHGATELFIAELLVTLAAGADRVAVPGPPRGGDARLTRVLRDLESQVRAGPLPFSRWREMTGLGRAQLDWIARRELGASLRVRRDEALLSAIRRVLARREVSLKETAAGFGFFDAAHFTRWVRRHAGVPPRRLRDHAP